MFADDFSDKDRDYHKHVSHPDLICRNCFGETLCTVYVLQGHTFKIKPAFGYCNHCNTFYVLQSMKIYATIEQLPQQKAILTCPNPIHGVEGPADTPDIALKRFHYKNPETKAKGWVKQLYICTDCTVVYYYHKTSEGCELLPIYPYIIYN